MNIGGEKRAPLALWRRKKEGLGWKKLGLGPRPFMIVNIAKVSPLGI